MISSHWVTACQPAFGTAGLADSEVWQAPLPADLAPGRYEVFTGLYRTRDQERIPANDLDGLAWVDGRVSLGSLIVEK